MTRGLIRTLRVCVLAAIVAIAGCASNSTATPRTAQLDADLGYEATLHKCRKLQPVRLNKRMNLPPNSLRISSCLRKRGWQPDGNRASPRP